MVRRYEARRLFFLPYLEEKKKRIVTVPPQNTRTRSYSQYQEVQVFPQQELEMVSSLK